MTERHAHRSLDRIEHDARVHVAHADDLDELLQHDVAERIEVRGHDVQHEVVFAGNPH